VRAELQVIAVRPFPTRLCVPVADNSPKEESPG
jgi:hypothetical protein